MSHKHQTKKTHLTIIEFDDVFPEKLARNTNYFGEGNSRERTLEFDFEYCLDCNLRLLNGKPIMTQDILQEELEKFVLKAKIGTFINSEKTTMQHTDFENFEHLIQMALAFGKLKEKQGQNKTRASMIQE